MNQTSLALVLFTLIVIVVCAVLVISFLMNELKRKSKEIDRLQIVVTDFINRAQSGDLPTYLSMHYNSATPVAEPAGFPDNLARDDQSELARSLGQTQGLGQEIFDDDPELDATLAEFGIEFPNR